MKTVFSLVFAILAIAMLGVVHISFGAALTATPNPFSLSNTTIVLLFNAVAVRPNRSFEGNACTGVSGIALMTLTMFELYSVT